MREFYTTAEATQNKFLFVSYSHEDKTTVRDWIDYLIDRGVRVWWDKAFLGGDDWETIAMELLSHENCAGILFFCSKNAIQSPNVAREWRAAARTKGNRSEGMFYPQIIMVEEDPTFDYRYLTNFVKRTEELFSDDDYDDFRDLFGKKDHLYYSANLESDKAALLQNIKQRAAQAVDEHEIIRDKIADLSTTNKEVVLKFGVYENHPITWHKIADEANQSTLLCQDILSDSLGGQPLNDWLEQFIRQSFSKHEQAELQGKVRLLTVSEAENLPLEELAKNKIWWLQETHGHLQAVVREDGTIYQSGYNHRLYPKGIRPVITIDSVTLYSLLNKSN